MNKRNLPTRDFTGKPKPYYRQGDYVECKRCGGTGELVSPPAQWAALLSLGILFPLLFMREVKEDCLLCEGLGYVRIGGETA